MKKLTATIIALLLVFSLGLACSLAEEPVYTLTITVPDEYWSSTLTTDTTEDYISKVFSIPTTSSSGPRKAPRLVGSRLTGTEAALYQLLMPWISEVAAGNITSTVISIPFEDILPSVTFTAEELGVGSIVENGAITSAAQTAAVSKLSLDLALVNDAILADCPAELYWFDKTVGEKLSKEIRLSANSKELTVIGSYNISFAVAEAYQFGTDMYRMDATFVYKLFSARAMAEMLVENAADLTDYRKLQNYCDEICDLVTYNYDAAGGGASYGDPWQLLWVFDGDDETNVVCEGYAKAFQYLCDLSTFNSGLTTISVTGKMGSENHMWNLVTIAGINYLVDVTNCDSLNTDGLFMVGYYQDLGDGSYIYRVFDNHDITYTYDDRTLALYSSDELTVANQKYVPFEPYTKYGNPDVLWITSSYGEEFFYEYIGNDPSFSLDNYKTCVFEYGKDVFPETTTLLMCNLDGVDGSLIYYLHTFNRSFYLDNYPDYELRYNGNSQAYLYAYHGSAESVVITDITELGIDPPVEDIFGANVKLYVELSKAPYNLADSLLQIDRGFYLADFPELELKYDENHQIYLNKYCGDSHEVDLTRFAEQYYIDYYAEGAIADDVKIYIDNTISQPAVGEYLLNHGYYRTEFPDYMFGYVDGVQYLAAYTGTAKTIVIDERWPGQLFAPSAIPDDVRIEVTSLENSSIWCLKYIPDRTFFLQGNDDCEYRLISPTGVEEDTTVCLYRYKGDNTHLTIDFGVGAIHADALPETVTEVDANDFIGDPHYWPNAMKDGTIKVFAEHNGMLVSDLTYSPRFTDPVLANSYEGPLHTKENPDVVYTVEMGHMNTTGYLCLDGYDGSEAVIELPGLYSHFSHRIMALHEEYLASGDTEPFNPFGRPLTTLAGSLTAQLLDRYGVPYNAQSLSQLVLPSSTEVIEDQAFWGIATNEIVIPYGCRSIGELAFADCTNLVLVHIPSSVTDIDPSAFGGCSQLTILCQKGSAAEAFAIDRGFPYQHE